VASSRALSALGECSPTLVGSLPCPRAGGHARWTVAAGRKPTSHTGSHGTTHLGTACVSPVGSGPDRLPTRTTPHDGPQGADPLRRATTGIHRASHQGAARAKPSSHRDEHVAPGNLVH